MDGEDNKPMACAKKLTSQLEKINDQIALAENTLAKEYCRGQLTHEEAGRILKIIVESKQKLQKIGEGIWMKAFE